MELTQTLSKHRILPFLDASRVQDLFPVIGALCSGGLPVICIGAGGDSSYETVASAVSVFGDMPIGVQVCDLVHAEIACRARVKFICSPGLSFEIAALCARQDIRYIPGCATPTEIMKAQEMGLTTVMLTPAELLGGKACADRYVSMFPGVKFIVCDKNAGEAGVTEGYLENPRLFACCDASLTEGSLEEIVEKCSASVEKYTK